MWFEKTKETKEIISHMNCNRCFRCLEDIDGLCLAEDINVEGYLECCEENSQSCGFSISFDRSFLCSCPLKFHLKKQTKR
jgi:hypothetical protein